MNKTRCINCMKIIDENIASCPHCGYGQKEEQSPFGIKPNTILRGRYLTGRVLGQGGFGITYVGYDLTLDIKVAIKEYFPMGLAVRNSTVSNQLQWNTTQFNSEQWERGCDSFLKEARRMAKIDSLPGIVRVRDTFPENKTAYIIMDYIEGENLKQRLMKTGSMSFSKCIELLEPLMESLGKMHQKGLVHRDISPDNIMVQPDGSACLLDFGAAKDVSFQQSMASQQVAKKGFSPPEQYREKGRIGSWTDVYALCATIYYCITGKMVPDAMDRMYEDTLDFDVPMQEPLDKAAVSALKDGLQLKSEARIQTVEELLQRLKELGQPITPRPSEPFKPSEPPKQSEQSKPSESSKPPKPSKKKKIIILSAAAVCVFLLVIVGIHYWDKEQDTDLSAMSVINSEQEQNRSITDAADTSESVSSDQNIEQTEYMMNSEQVQDNAEQEPDGQQSAEEDGDGKTSNILMYDGRYGEVPVPDRVVFESEISRKTIKTISFTDTLDSMADTAWDVSWAHDGSVMAWTEQNSENTEMYDLFIGAEGGVAGKNCDYLFYGYENVEKIEFNDCFDTSRVISMSDMFGSCHSLTQLDVSGFDTSQVKDMSNMFADCESLTELDISNFDTSQVTDMSYMFYQYESSNLAYLKMSSLNTSQVTNMRGMFYGCDNLTELDVSSFDTSQVEDMRYMFYGCHNLTGLDVSSFNTSKVTDMYGMFCECINLTQLDVSGFDISQVENREDMFCDCGVTAEEAGLKE